MADENAIGIELTLNTSGALKEVDKVEKKTKQLAEAEERYAKAAKEALTVNQKLGRKLSGGSDGGRGGIFRGVGGFGGARALAILGGVGAIVGSVGAALSKLNKLAEARNRKTDSYLSVTTDPTKGRALEEALYKKYGGDKETIASDVNLIGRLRQASVVGDQTALNKLTLSGVSLFDKEGLTKNVSELFYEIMEKAAKISNETVRAAYLSNLGLSSAAIYKGVGLGREKNTNELLTGFREQLKETEETKKYQEVLDRTSDKVESSFRSLVLGFNNGLKNFTSFFARQFDSEPVPANVASPAFPASKKPLPKVYRTNRTDPMVPLRNDGVPSNNKSDNRVPQEVRGGNVTNNNSSVNNIYVNVQAGNGSPNPHMVGETIANAVSKKLKSQGAR